MQQHRTGGSAAGTEEHTSWRARYIRRALHVQQAAMARRRTQHGKQAGTARRQYQRRRMANVTNRHECGTFDTRSPSRGMRRTPRRRTQTVAAASSRKAQQKVEETGCIREGRGGGMGQTFASSDRVAGKDAETRLQFAAAAGIASSRSRRPPPSAENHNRYNRQ